MPFNIQSFKSSIDNNGTLQTNRFQVIVTPPPILRNKTLSVAQGSTSIAGIANELRFRADSVRLPSVHIQTADVARYGLGTTEKQPFAAQFSETMVSFMTDRAGLIWQFWYHWMREILQFSGTDNAPTGLYSNSPASLSLNYKSEYQGSVQIEVFDTFGKTAMSMTLNGAFPFVINESPMNWGENNTLHRVVIGLAYTNFSSYSSALSTAPTN